MPSLKSGNEKPAENLYFLSYLIENLNFYNFILKSNIKNGILYTGKPRKYGRVLNSKKKRSGFSTRPYSMGGVKILITGRSKTLETGRNGHFSHWFLYRWKTCISKIFLSFHMDNIVICYQHYMRVSMVFLLFTIISLFQ